MKTHEVLERASRVLLQDGLWKGTNVDGRGSCLLIAIVHAGEARDLERTAPHLGAAIGLTVPFDTVDIIAWNDRPETTFAMAYGALIEAARLAKEAES